MLSFFSKKKHGHETPPEDVIQGPDSQPSNADDFIFVEKKPADVPNPNSSMYPPLLPTYGNSGLPYPGAYQHSADRVTNNIPVSYVQGVPFELSPQLCAKSSFELAQLQVDGILALMTRQMSVDEDYSFALERSVQNESEY